MKSLFFGILSGFQFYSLAPFKEALHLNFHDFFNPKTPYGYPSHPIEIWKYCKDKEKSLYFAFLNRYGKEHKFLSEELPYLANLYALKLLGVTTILALDFVGVLREHFKLGNFVVPHQCIDFSTLRNITFFGKGVSGGVKFIDPFSKKFHQFFFENFKNKKEDSNKFSKFCFYQEGIYFAIEGTNFPTAAEINLYTSWGVDCIGFSIPPEAKLAAQLSIDYLFIGYISHNDRVNSEKENQKKEATFKLEENYHKALELFLWYWIEIGLHYSLNVKSQESGENFIFTYKMKKSIKQQLKKLGIL